MTPSWQKQLRQSVAQPRKDNAPVQIAILGVGNELNGDDAAGILLARALLRCQARALFPQSILVIDAGLAPENFSGRLRSFAPDQVILVDAALMDAPPGEIRWLDLQSAAGLSASTHTLPLSMFSSYLTRELGCQVALLGIQALQTNPGHPTSMPIRNAIRRMVRSFVHYLNIPPGHSLP